MNNNLTYKKFLFFGLLGIVPLLTFFFLYDLETKWIIFGSSIAALCLGSIMYIIICCTKRKSGSPSLDEQGPYLTIMYTGVSLMTLSVYALINLTAARVLSQASSGNPLRNNVWTAVCIGLLAGGYGLYKFKMSARYLLIGLSLFLSAWFLIIEGNFLIRGEGKTAFSYFLLSNMSPIGLWLWVSILLFLFQPQTIQTIREYNNPEVSRFKADHPTVLKVKRDLNKCLTLAIAVACLRFGPGLTKNNPRPEPVEKEILEKNIERNDMEEPVIPDHFRA